MGSPLPDNAMSLMRRASGGHLRLHEVAMQNFMQKCPQLRFEPAQINYRRRSAFELGNLAINAAPVACIVGIEVDAYRHASRAARHYRIDVSHPRDIAAVVLDMQ